VAWPAKVERFQKLLHAMLEDSDADESDTEDSVIASITQTLDRMRAAQT
jgi:hypothetical protein